MSSPLSGFTAIPNPQMLAFMPIQSYLMMYFAGAGWQIGKRKISAIPNDEFNKMSANDLLKGFTADLRQTIPTMEQSLQDITPLVETLIRQYGDFARKIIDVLPEVAKELVDPTLSQAQIGFEKLFHRLTTSPFPSLPKAGGAHADDFISSSKNVLQQQAIDKQKAFEIQRERDRIASIPGRIAFSKTKQPVPQVNVKFKKAAGQSQIMERKRLINLIAIATVDLKKTSGDTNLRAQKVAQIRRFQQSLVNLLERYRF